MISKESQLEWNKEKKVSTFGKAKSSLKKRSKKVQKEKSSLSSAYYKYLHESGQCCVVCGTSNIELHHITDIHRIEGDRRVWNRIVPLCLEHHKNGKDGIHILSKKEFYERVMSLEKLMEKSLELYQEYLGSK